MSGGIACPLGRAPIPRRPKMKFNWRLRRTRLFVYDAYVIAQVYDLYAIASGASKTKL
jgi:hypothetical protein